MIQIKSTSTLLFVVLLTGWVHLTSSQPPLSSPDPYSYFVYRLGQAIDDSTPYLVPFSLKAHVIQDLMSTSNEFKDLCLHYDFELSHSNTYTPVTALMKTIDHTFHNYIHSAKTISSELETIKSVNPIGFNVYLTKNDVTISSPKFMESVAEFQATMNQRVRLLNMKTNDSCFEIFSKRNSGTPQNFSPHSINISSIARDEIATEYGPLSDYSIDSFTDLATEKLCTKMYRIGTAFHKYQEHNPSKANDVQILYGTLVRKKEFWTRLPVSSHPICVYYKKSDEKVYIYNSLMRVGLDRRQLAIIHRLYPFYKGIVFDSRTAIEAKQPTGGVFAITYASMLLQGKDPAETPIKLNKVCGDETLYMRIHLLNMLANRKLSILN